MSALATVVRVLGGLSLALLGLGHALGAVAVVHWMGWGAVLALVVFALRALADLWALTRLLWGGRVGEQVALGVLAAEVGINLISLAVNPSLVDLITPIVHPLVLLSFAAVVWWSGRHRAPSGPALGAP